MLMPTGITPLDDASWAVTISYEQDGHVFDDDAHDINYAELLTQMKKDTSAASHKLHWAKELKFGNSTSNTLNYNIRMLGRKGILVLNFIAGMEQKAQIEAELPTVLAMADFDEGSRYSDFDPDVDKVAAYGIGALIAGKVVAKTGLLAGALLLLKKFGVFLLVGLGAFFKRLFGGKDAEA